MALFRRLNAERGMTVMLVTHEPDVAAHAAGSSPSATATSSRTNRCARKVLVMISLMQTLRLALQALMRNRSRSLLTMLGVVIGVAAVIVTVAIGTGAKTSVANQINGLGSQPRHGDPGQRADRAARAPATAARRR